MDVVIGIQDSHRELQIETDDSAEAVRGLIQEAVDRDERMLWLVDSKGRQIGVPVKRITFVELSEEGSGRRVGFGSAASA